MDTARGKSTIYFSDRGAGSTLWNFNLLSRVCLKVNHRDTIRCTFLANDKNREAGRMFFNISNENFYANREKLRGKGSVSTAQPLCSKNVELTRT